MKYFLAFIIMLAIGGGCRQRILKGVELENKLIETMTEYLDTTLQPGVRFTVKDVIYYPEKGEKRFLCQFNVDMHFGKTDTTGIMAAIISNDFSTVVRTQ